MELRDLQAELSIKTIEFEFALDKGLPSDQLKELYKELKELQYRITMAQIKQTPSVSDEIIE